MNENGTLTSSDALLVLKAAVGQGVELSCPPLATVRRTGQVVCYDTDGKPVDCAGTGQDGDLRKGAAPGFLDQGNGTVTDGSTGLVWEKLSDDGSIHDRDDVYVWADAYSSKIAVLNAAGFAGQTDWRLPNVRELETLTDYSRFSPAIAAPFDSGCQPGCTATTCSCSLAEGTYWSSTSYESDPMLAWALFLPNGAVTANYKANGASVRAVRGGF